MAGTSFWPNLPNNSRFYDLIQPLTILFAFKMAAYQECAHVCSLDSDGIARIAEIHIVK
jgi:hypothetical protein